MFFSNVVQFSRSYPLSLFRRQLRYYIIPSSLCQHLSPIFFSNLPRSRAFRVKLSTSCGKLTTSLHAAYLHCSTSPLRTIPHKIRTFCTNTHSLFCGKPQITVQLSGIQPTKSKRPALGGTRVFCLFWILKDFIVI